MLELDIVALTQLTHLFTIDMVERNHGYIFQIGSTGSFQPTSKYAAYSVAESYVLGLGEALHFESRNTAVKCIVLCRGVTRKEFLESAGQQPNAYQRALMMEGEAVLSIRLKALLKGWASVVSGMRNAFLAWGTRFLPLQTLTAVSARLMR